MNRAEQLKKYLKYWKILLNLQQWDLSIEEFEFKRKDYPQSEDIKVDLKNKSAKILISKEETGKDKTIILHELIHLILWDLDSYAEKRIKNKDEKNTYFYKLENTVSTLTKIITEKDK